MSTRDLVIAMLKQRSLMTRLILRTYGTFLPIAGSLLVPAVALAGIPVVSGITLTDLTTRSFAVVWESSEPATGSLQLFQSDCVTPIPNPLLSAEQSDRTGIIKVTVSELDANTTYCYKTESTSTSSSEVTIAPLQAIPIKTQTSVIRTTVSGTTTTPLANDIMKVPASYSASLPANPTGILAILRVEPASTALPLSLLLSADETRNYFDMNNLFDPQTASSRNLTGGERVRITERHGLLGCTLDRFRKIPADQEITKEADFLTCNPLDVDCSGGITVLDILRVAKSAGTAQGGLCFNNDLDVNADGTVDQLDVEAEIGGFNATTF